MDQVTLLYDASGAPITQAFAPLSARPAQALSSPQGGLITLGADYASSPSAQVPKVDSVGNQYMVPVNPTGSPTMVYTGQAAPAQASQYGSLCMARMDSPTPSSFFPLQLDPVMALNVHQKSKVTFRAIVAGVTCAANKSLISLSNGSGLVIRINEVFVYVPPQGSGGNLVGLGSATTYIPLICEIRRISSNTKGTSAVSVGSCPSDTGDTLDPGVLVYSAATIVNTGNAFYRGDALVSSWNGFPFYNRGDSNEKSLVVRPGEAISVTCLSSGTIASGGSTTTAVADMHLVYTQAPA